MSNVTRLCSRPPSRNTSTAKLIVIPDETFGRVEKRAAALRMSRSEFYTRAAQRYLEELESSELSQLIDEAIALTEGDESNAVAVAAGRTRIAEASGDC